MVPKLSIVCRCSGLIVCALALLATAGCKPSDEITSYDAFKADTQVDRPLNRMLVALYFRPDNLWTLKLIGPEAKVAEEEPAFKQFLATVHFAENGDPTLNKLPNWHEEKAEGSFARFTVGLKDDGVDLTVVKVGRDKAQNVTILANVNRWRRQLDLPRIGIDDLETFAKPFEPKDGEKYVLVDLKGAGSGKTVPGGMMFPGGPKKPPNDLLRQNGQVTYDTPEGWRQTKDDGPQGIVQRAASLEVGEGDAKALITIVPMGKLAGSLLANVNRWGQQQLGLPEITQGELSKLAQDFIVNGSRGFYVDLTGPEGKERKRILAVMVQQRDRTWFIKMIGPSELVGRQKTAFETFVKSVKLPGGR